MDTRKTTRDSGQLYFWPMFCGSRAANVEVPGAIVYSFG